MRRHEHEGDSSSPSGTHLSLLVEFMCDAFNTEELRELALFHLGADSLSRLPGEASTRAALAFSFVERLHEQKLVDRDLLAELERRRPRRQREIEALRRAWSSIAPETSNLEASDPELVEVFVGCQHLSLTVRMKIELALPSRAVEALIVSRLGLPTTFERDGFGFHISYSLSACGEKISPQVRLQDAGVRAGDYLGLEIEATPFSRHVRWSPASLAFSPTETRSEEIVSRDELIRLIQDRMLGAKTEDEDPLI